MPDLDFDKFIAESMTAAKAHQINESTMAGLAIAYNIKKLAEVMNDIGASIDDVGEKIEAINTELGAMDIDSSAIETAVEGLGSSVDEISNQIQLAVVEMGRQK